MQFTNIHGLPESLAEALRGDAYDLKNPPPNIFSLTTIAKTPRMVQLERRHDDEIEVDVVERGWTLFGSSIHYALGVRQNKQAERLSEERVYIDTTTWEIHTCPRGVQATAAPWYRADHYYVSCKWDNYEQEKRGWILQDYKVTSVWGVIIDKGQKPDWKAQLNIEAFALRKLGFTVDRLEDILILRDFSAREAKNKSDYPRTQFFVAPVEMWDDQKCTKYITERMGLHMVAQTTEDSALPLCGAEDRWAKPDTFAVMKQGTKKAVRVLGSMEAAQQYIIDNRLDGRHYVETRQGIDQRCAEYCNACRFCDYWKENYGKDLSINPSDADAINAAFADARAA